MKIILFGASGMVGQGVLRECLLADDVSDVLCIGRTRIGNAHPKLRQIVRADLFDYADVEDELRGFDACFFTLGVSASEVDEASYARTNHDLPLAAASVLARLNPQMTFAYVSGAHTDGSEQGRVMWARVKGRTENALLRLPFKAAVMFRPGAILPAHGEVSKTRAYRIFYRWFGWSLPPLRRLFPNHILGTEQIGIAMLQAARGGSPKHVLEIADIVALAQRAGNLA